MNGIQYITDRLEQAQKDYARCRKDNLVMKKLYSALPEEIKKLDISYMWGWSWNEKELHLQYTDPDCFEVLKMAGVMGLKRVFNGENRLNEDSWSWEGGKMVVRIDEDITYTYIFSITKAHKPTSCRFEEQEVEIPARIEKKLVAICPESLEEL